MQREESLPGNGNLVPLARGSERAREIAQMGGAALAAKRREQRETEAELRQRIVKPETVLSAWSYFEDRLSGKRNADPDLTAICRYVVDQGVGKARQLEEAPSGSVEDTKEILAAVFGGLAEFMTRYDELHGTTPDETGVVVIDSEAGG